MSKLVRKIAYTPLPAQRRFHNCGARFKVFTGPVGSGKSAALAQECIRLSVLNAGIPGLIGAPTYRMLEDVTKRAILEVLENNRIPHSHLKSDNIIFLKELNVPIFCRSLEEPTRLVGSNLAWFGIDEATYCKEASFLRLQARLRHPHATALCGFGVCTPNGFDWVYSRFIGELKNQNYEAIRASPRENVHLPEDYYDQLAASYDERFFRQEVLGEFLSLNSGSVYHAFDRQLHVKPSIQYRANAQLWLCVDFNVDPMAWVVAQVVDHAPTVYTSSPATKTIEVLDEIVIRDSNIDLNCREFVTRMEKYIRNGQRLRVNIAGDAAGNSRSHAGPSDYALMKTFFARQSDFDLQWHLNASNPAVKDRVNSVNACFLNANGQVRLTIHPNCQALIKDFERMVWAKDSNGNTVDGFDKKDKLLSHASDALGYLVEKEFSASRQTTTGWKNHRLI